MTVAVKRARWKKSSKDWRDLNENWWKAVGRNMDRKTMCGKCKRASRHEARVWQPESSMEVSRWCRALLAAPQN